jgi:hypothetical protein
MEPLALTVAVLLGRGAAEHAGARAADAMVRLSQRLTALVARRFQGDDAANEALERVRQSAPPAPSGPATQSAPPAPSAAPVPPAQEEEPVTALAAHLDRHIAADADFARRLRDAVAEAAAQPEAGRIVVTVQDNARVGKVASFGTVHGDVTF